MSESEEPPGEEPTGDEQPQRGGLERLLPTGRKGRIAFGAAALTALLASGGLLTGYLLVDIPDPNAVAAAQNNVYLYSDGTQFARDGEVNRQKVELDDIPESTRQAVLAAEDRNFYHQSAIDITAMIRAGWNMLQGEGKQSGSTITQQYVKNYYLGQEQTLTRKTKELFIALKLDHRVSKDEILTGYLNTSYFGRNSYGIQAAAQAYYDKHASELTTAEGAYLAALLNSPNLYDVAAHPDNRDRAVARWRYVLNGMVQEGWLKAAERDAMKFPEPRPAKRPTALSGQRGYLVEAVNTNLVERGILDKRQLARGGLRITTTIDRARQDALVEAVEKELLSQLDDEREVDHYVRAGATSIEPGTGEVVAMYGGIGYTEQYVNNATRRDYQAGSTFKPIVYAAAVHHRARTRGGELIGPDTTYDGTSGRTVIGADGPTDWAPHNQDHANFGSITVTRGMQKSVNAVFAQMGADVGPEKVKKTAVALGLSPNTPNMAESHTSISLGTATPSTLDMAQAYATLANHGKRVDHTFVTKITRNGENIPVPEPDTRQAVSRQAADSTTAVLREVVEAGTGSRARALGRPAAGKTGTGEENEAAWFAGYTPDLATVVVIMGQDPETGVHKSLYGAAGMPRINGSDFPTLTWTRYTAQALRGTPVRKFDLKPGKHHRMPGASPSASPDEDTAPEEESTQAADSATPAAAPGDDEEQGREQDREQDEKNREKKKEQDRDDADRRKQDGDAGRKHPAEEEKPDEAEEADKAEETDRKKKEKEAAEEEKRREREASRDDEADSGPARRSPDPTPGPTTP
ncbi:transglycosylase domain-containing protein [Streptomyces sp. TRM 70361]|uniref:transglycosylase domain-containing protein n=1 Tax=Streptomyces sp. TRM 70361 TaxID=3116553 RepID=UPI002E7C2171|nr:transglycosylase domain-containing protein [Streptomyces sp. TRM 70361]MEE1937904.1 transglycosylase domain-containing protein [Streptomyces sp. TRM 70361]